MSVATLAQSQQVALNFIDISVFVLYMVVTVVLGFNFLGDGLRDALDPRTHLLKFLGVAQAVVEDALVNAADAIGLRQHLHLHRRQGSPALQQQPPHRASATRLVQHVQRAGVAAEPAPQQQVAVARRTRGRAPPHGLPAESQSPSTSQISSPLQYEPSSAIVHPGLWAPSHGCPSVSTKMPSGPCWTLDQSRRPASTSALRCVSRACRLPGARRTASSNQCRA